MNVCKWQLLHQERSFRWIQGEYLMSQNKDYCLLVRTISNTLQTSDCRSIASQERWQSITEDSWAMLLISKEATKNLMKVWSRLSEKTYHLSRDHQALWKIWVMIERKGSKKVILGRQESRLIFQRGNRWDRHQAFWVKMRISFGFRRLLCKRLTKKRQLLKSKPLSL